MASSGDSKTFKQDMVVSIRYRNDLPPPPMPPKLLDIDTGGLAQYLTTGYASSLVRREEPNIEVDAEGGMPIDMVGVPGYFLGDESAIMAPEIQPVLDPADHALMLTAEQLRSHGAKNNVSFLRKTQYMTSGQNARANDPLVRTNARTKQSVDNKTAPAPVARDDKENIKRHIQKGFDIAYPESIPYNPPEAKGVPSTPQERDAWRNPLHPDNPRLKPVAFYPILPDLDAVTDVGATWHSVKFEKPPLPPYHSRRDDRVDVALLMASENTAQARAWRVKKETYDKHPDLYEDPGPEPYTWSMHVPKRPESVTKIRKVFNDADPQKDDLQLREDLLEESADGSLRIPFERVRVYQSATQSTVDSRRFMAISLYDSESAPPHSRLHKQGSAAYYYPILERLRLKADRGKLGKAPTATAADEATENIPDQLMVLPREPTAREMMARLQFRGEYDAAFVDEYAEIVRQAEAEEEASREDDEPEQGAVHDGEQDVAMEEVRTNGVGHKDINDDRNTPGRVNGDRKDVDAMEDD